jgi:hypothetical protein
MLSILAAPRDERFADIKMIKIHSGLTGLNPVPMDMRIS